MSEENPKRLSWSLPESPPPKRPYRDTAALYGVLAVVIVLIAWLTGGGIGKAVAIAAAFFLAATAWSFWQWRGRLRRAKRDADARRDRVEERAP